jgi:hypothetical protein
MDYIREPRAMRVRYVRELLQRGGKATIGLLWTAGILLRRRRIESIRDSTA